MARTRRARRFSDVQQAAVDSLLRRHAFLLRRSPDYSERGLQNSDIVQAAHAEAKELLARSVDELVTQTLMQRVSQVLGVPSPDQPVAAFILPGLDLPVWFAIPAEDGIGSPEWKYGPDVTPIRSLGS